MHHWLIPLRSDHSFAGVLIAPLQLVENPVAGRGRAYVGRKRHRLPAKPGAEGVIGAVLQEIKDSRNPQLEPVRGWAITGVTELDDCPEEA